MAIPINIDAKQNIESAIAALESVFSSVECSPIYESESVGFKGNNFLNLVVSVEADLELKTQ